MAIIEIFKPSVAFLTTKWEYRRGLYERLTGVPSRVQKRTSPYTVDRMLSTQKVRIEKLSD